MRQAKEGARAATPRGESAGQPQRAAPPGASSEEAPFFHPPEGVERVEPPRAPFLGSRELEIPLEEVFPLLNETTLFRGQCSYRRGKLDAESYARLIEEEVRPEFERLKRAVAEEGYSGARGVRLLHLLGEPERNQLSLATRAGRASSRG